MYTDIQCNFLCFLVPARAGSNAAPLRLKSGPDPVQMRFESNAAVAHPVRLTVFFGLEIGLQWFTNPYNASRQPVPPPPSPAPRGQHKSVAPLEGTVLLPPLPPRVIRRCRETGGCHGAGDPGQSWHCQCSQTLLVT